jgi:hypothetical protein
MIQVVLRKPTNRSVQWEPALLLVTHLPMNKTNLLIDLALFAAFLVAMEPALTGIPLHEWLSLALAAWAVVHILLHWNWVLSVGARLIKNVYFNSRIKFVVDVLLFIAFTLVMLTGLMISQSVMVFLGFQPARAPVWRALHDQTANATLLLVAFHFALDWSWLATMTHRYLLAPLASLFHRRAAHPSAAPVESAHK